jgi:ABC-type branched-subunit amino acid transport system substrate-binding protein
VRDFVARFQAAYGVSPTILAAQGYDAGRLLLHLLGRGQVRERQALRQALATEHDFSGISGFVCFGPPGEAVQTLFLLQVQDGSVVQIN